MSRSDRRKRKKRIRKKRKHYYGYTDHNAGIESWSAKDEWGNVVEKSAKLPPEVMAFFEGIRDAYEEKLGAPPPPHMTIAEAAEVAGTPLPTSEELMAVTVAAMEKAGIPPEMIYAFKKTGGLLVTERNKHLIDDRELAAWNYAVDEYLESHSQNGGADEDET